MSAETDYEVLRRAGTDGSYDLVVEVISPRPEATVIWRGEAGASPERLSRAARAVAEQFGERCVEQGVGLRLCFFQRLPDPFVITARVKAALHAAPP